MPVNNDLRYAPPLYLFSNREIGDDTEAYSGLHPFFNSGGAPHFTYDAEVIQAQSGCCHMLLKGLASARAPLPDQQGGCA